MADKPAKKLYCPSCGVESDTFTVLKHGDEILHCERCGLNLSENPELPPVKSLNCIVFAEDSDLLRILITSTLFKKVSKEVIPCRNGVEFVSTTTRRLKENLPIDYVILDVEMPVLNGIQAAATLREIEKGLNREQKIPLLFFTVRKCDDEFKKFLKAFEPASFVNKGTSTSPEELSDRLYRVIQKLIHIP